MFVLGGLAASRSFDDMWTSYDGGVTWHQCRVDGRKFIRNDMAAALTADEELVVGQGTRYDVQPGHVVTTEYTDLWISDTSLSNFSDVSRYCGGTMPSSGLGYFNVTWLLLPVFSSSSTTASQSSSPSQSVIRSSSSSPQSIIRSSSSSSVRRVVCRYPYYEDNGRCYCQLADNSDCYNYCDPSQGKCPAPSTDSSGSNCVSQADMTGIIIAFIVVILGVAVTGYLIHKRKSKDQRFALSLTRPLMDVELMSSAT